MASPIQVLLIEGSESDARLVVRELKRGGYEPRWERVDTTAALQAAIQRQPWDLITCDWIMPGFGAPAALALLKEHGVEAPIIIISVEVGEEVAVTAMKAGAHHFVSKQRLTRLVPAVERELRETEVRRTRRRAEEALRSSERRYRRLFETAKDGILILDALTGQIEDVNPFLLQLLGYSREELVGKRLWEISPFKDVAENQEAFKELQAKAYERYEHLPLETKDGRRVAVEFVSNSYQENGHRIIQCNVRDITERKRVEEQLVVQGTALAKGEEARQRGDQRFRALIEKSLDLISIVDRDGTYRYLNPAHEAVYGFRPDELVGTKAFDRLHPDDAQKLVPTLADAIRTGVKAATVEYRLRHEDGSWRAFEGVALNLLDDPEIAGILITGRDITERKRVEERTSLLLQFATDISGTFDLDERLDRIQRRTARALPCDGVVTVYWQPAEQGLRIIAAYGLSAEFRAEAEARACQFVAREAFGDWVASGETAVINGFRETTPLLAGIAERFGITALVAAPLHLQGRSLGVLVAFRTDAGQPFERHQADLCAGIAAQIVIAIESLKLHRQQQEEAVVSGALARVGQELISSLSTFTLLDRLCKITKEVLGCDRSYTVLRDPDKSMYAVVAMAGGSTADSEEVRALRLPAEALTGLLAALSQQEVVQVDMRTPPTTWAALPIRYGVAVALYTPLRRDQEIIGVHAAAFRGRTQPFSHVQEHIARGIGQLASVALENARLHEELESANRLKTDFMAAMSHELRTPLNIIMGYTDLLLQGEFGSLAPAQAATLQRTQKSASELLQLVNGTLDLGPLEAGHVPLNIAEVSVRDLINELALETEVIQERPGLSWVWNVAPDVPVVHTDAGKLKVVLNNLLRNAAKFTEAGTVTVAADAKHGGVEISVSDTGIGIAPEVLPIIFESFRQGESSMTSRFGGVGLGLYIVRRLLDLLGATIRVDSELGRGSTFRVWLPLVPTRSTISPARAHAQ
jgi:PAS domain S-box-containing protein